MHTCQAQQGCAQLQLDLLSYKGFAADAITSMMQEQLEPVLQARRQASQQLKDAVTNFLSRQAAEWELLGKVLSSWLMSVAMLFEQHKMKGQAMEQKVKAELKVRKRGLWCGRAQAAGRIGWEREGGREQNHWVGAGQRWEAMRGGEAEKGARRAGQRW